MAASNGNEYFDLEMSVLDKSFVRSSNAELLAKDEQELLWVAIERLPSHQQSNYALLVDNEKRTKTINVRKLDRNKRELVVKQALATNDQDNFKLLSGIKQRLDRAGVVIPKVEIRFHNLKVVADVQAGSRTLPTLINYSYDVIENILTSLRLMKVKRYPLTILNDVSGLVKPRRTSAYISQSDNHLAELTVRETLDFAARCQGASESFAGERESAVQDLR
ncbi:ABC transporter G family member 31, partial [Cucurbita argyrosperma subsp. sororia]